MKKDGPTEADLQYFQSLREPGPWMGDSAADLARFAAAAEAGPNIAQKTREEIDQEKLGTVMYRAGAPGHYEPVAHKEQLPITINNQTKYLPTEKKRWIRRPDAMPMVYHPETGEFLGLGPNSPTYKKRKGEKIIFPSPEQMLKGYDMKKDPKTGKYIPWKGGGDESQKHWNWRRRGGSPGTAVGFGDLTPRIISRTIQTPDDPRTRYTGGRRNIDDIDVTDFFSGGTGGALDYDKLKIIKRAIERKEGFEASPHFGMHATEGGVPIFPDLKGLPLDWPYDTEITRHIASGMRHLLPYSQRHSAPRFAEDIMSDVRNEWANKTHEEDWEDLDYKIQSDPAVEESIAAKIAEEIIKSRNFGRAHGSSYEYEPGESGAPYRLSAIDLLIIKDALSLGGTLAAKVLQQAVKRIPGLGQKLVHMRNASPILQQLQRPVGLGGLGKLPKQMDLLLPKSIQPMVTPKLNWGKILQDLKAGRISPQSLINRGIWTQGKTKMKDLMRKIGRPKSPKTGPEQLNLPLQESKNNIILEEAEKLLRENALVRVFSRGGRTAEKVEILTKVAELVKTGQLDKKVLRALEVALASEKGGLIPLETLQRLERADKTLGSMIKRRGQLEMIPDDIIKNNPYIKDLIMGPNKTTVTKLHPQAKQREFQFGPHAMGPEGPPTAKVVQGPGTGEIGRSWKTSDIEPLITRSRHKRPTVDLSTLETADPASYLPRSATEALLRAEELWGVSPYGARVLEPGMFKGPAGAPNIFGMNPKHERAYLLYHLLRKGYVPEDFAHGAATLPWKGKTIRHRFDPIKEIETKKHLEHLFDISRSEIEARAMELAEKAGVQRTAPHNIMADPAMKDIIHQVMQEFIPKQLADVHDINLFNFMKNTPPEFSAKWGPEHKRVQHLVKPEQIKQGLYKPDPHAPSEPISPDLKLIKSPEELKESLKGRLNEETQHIAVDITLKYNNDFSFYGYVLNQIRAIDGITIAKADEAGVVDISPERQQILLHLKFMPIGSLSRYFWYLKNELKKIQDTSGDKIDSVQIRGIPRQID